jgi:hypothetical protein
VHGQSAPGMLRVRAPRTCRKSRHPHLAQRSSSVSQGAASNTQALAHHGVLDPARAWPVRTIQRSFVRDHSGRSGSRTQTHSQLVYLQRISWTLPAGLRGVPCGSQPGHPRERPYAHKSPSDSGTSTPQPERRRSRAAATQATAQVLLTRRAPVNATQQAVCVPLSIRRNVPVSVNQCVSV